MFYEHLSFKIHIHMDTKKCFTCGIEKSEDDFYKKIR